MRRHAKLQPLSREHHHTLKLARRLQAGEPGDALDDELADHREALAAHFAAEEAIAREVRRQCPDDRVLLEQLARMEREHREIERLLADALAGRDSREGYRRLGESLINHVRFEERELFNRLQAAGYPFDQGGGT
ncbi:hemerythrin domain-containing protein [Guyparkeria sp.]|uniref:hemerythrin domain-containing protein n=1 Tax=Guyparkeria sp. TaxID=2035736 RepID=UPI003564FACB